MRPRTGWFAGRRLQRGGALLLVVLSAFGCTGSEQKLDEASVAEDSGAEPPDEATPEAAPDVFVAALSVTPEGVRVGEPVNRSQRAGYDNQPQFTTDGLTLLFTSEEGGNTDIRAITLEGGDPRRITSTAPESEYSAVPIPGRTTFAAVRVEADSTQRLWEFDRDGTAVGPVFEDLAPVGYHAWSDSNTAVMFVLGDPPTLRVGNSASGQVRVVDTGIGRSIQRIPPGSEISYQRVRESGSMIMALDPQSGNVRELIEPVDGGQDHAWTPDGHLLMGSGSTLYAGRPDEDRGWEPVADLSAWGTELSRLAVSPDGRLLALVMIPNG